MTSTNITSGFGETNRSSSKVLRPPGGGSSDIFGPTDTLTTPRSVRNHMASNIFGSTQNAAVKNNGDSARRAQKNIDSYSRLFGEPDRASTSSKNHMKSSIPIGLNEGGKARNGNGTVSNTSSSSTSPSTTTPAPSTNGHSKKCANGGGEHLNGISKPDGNPVTGEGYKPAGAEINTTIPSLNGANQVINKNRIPPGGYSSGLW